MTEPELKSFFYPSSICVVGASSKEKSIGYEILRSIKSYGYTGTIYPVNPKAEQVLGYKCYPSISSINEIIELAIIIVPKKFVEQSIDDLISRGVKSIILITAGFRETGKEGEELENRILEKVRNSNARLLGPNCMGVINSLSEIKLNATFVAEKPEVGATGFLSQSGALGAAVLNSLRDTDIKFSHFISVGNKADINENHILEFWNKDKNIHTLTFYLESFSNGNTFIKPFIFGEINKPVIVLKAGRTDSGMKAASSHTGALSSSDKVVDSILKQFGIIRVDDISELFNTAKGFENFPKPNGKRIAVVTNAGGPAILAVDKIEFNGLILAKISEETKNKLREFVNPEGSVDNPVDLLPGATADIYKSTVETVLEDESVDAVISIFVEPVMVEPMGVVESINEIESEKPVFQVVMPLPEFWENYRKNSKYRYPLFRTPEDPSKVLSNILFYNERKKEILCDKDEYQKKFNLEKVDLLKSEKGYLSQEKIKLVAEKYNLPIINEILINKNEIENIYQNLTFPLVVKGINQSLVHKSDLNAVKLNIASPTELFDAVNEIDTSLTLNQMTDNKFLIQPYIENKFEVLIGGFRDPSFGPMIMFGTGGKYVEVLQDTQMKSAYSSKNDILAMIEKTKIGRILQGIRNEKAADINQLIEIILSVSILIIENENITELDINPLVITKDSDYHIVDMRIKVD